MSFKLYAIVLICLTILISVAVAAQSAEKIARIKNSIPAECHFEPSK